LTNKEALLASPTFKEEMEAIKDCLAQQLSDLRSSIFREVCRMLVALAGGLGYAFEDCMPFFLPILFTRLYVTIKIISSSSDECIRTLLQCTRTPKSLAVLFRGATTDSHAIVRSRCAEYLSQYLNQTQKEEVDTLADTLSNYTEAVNKCIADSDKDVRSAARMLFAAFEVKWPQQARTLFVSFSPTIQRTIIAEKKQTLIRLANLNSFPNSFQDATHDADDNVDANSHKRKNTS